MSTATFIDPATDPRKAYEALLASLHRMAAHDPLANEDKGPASPELIPAPQAVARKNGFVNYLGFTSQQDYDTLPGQPWTISRGDALVVDPGAGYVPGDTILAASPDDEFTLVGVRADGSFCWMARVDDDLDPSDFLVIGVVVEVRKGRKTGTGAPTVIARPARVDTSLVLQVLEELGSRDEDDWLPELLPAPLAMSRCDGDSGQPLYLPNAFAMVVTNDTFDAPNRRGWRIHRGDVLVFTTESEDIVFPDDIYLVLQGAELTMGDANLCSLRDGEVLGREASIVARAIQHRPLGQIGGGQ